MPSPAVLPGPCLLLTAWPLAPRPLLRVDIRAIVGTHVELLNYVVLKLCTPAMYPWCRVSTLRSSQRLVHKHPLFLCWQTDWESTFGEAEMVGFDKTSSPRSSLEWRPSCTARWLDSSSNSHGMSRPACPACSLPSMQRALPVHSLRGTQRPLLLLSPRSMHPSSCSTLAEPYVRPDPSAVSARRPRRRAERRSSDFLSMAPAVVGGMWMALMILNPRLVACLWS